MQEAYRELHREGHAHSIECWDGDELIGGLYGVWVRGVFSGESMFFRRDNASRLCVWRLVVELRRWGVEWIDTQMVTPVLESFGARLISRGEYLQLLRAAQTAYQKGKTVPSWGVPLTDGAWFQAHSSTSEL
jgi:leucyl/phenylalanyl-tRNA--protein transferase